MYDVIVVGGGPAGISAALVLGRCNRRVLLCDSGRYRNGHSQAVHGFLSRDGISPAELRRIGREQLAPYSVKILEAEVTSATRTDRGFRVQLGGGGGQAEARKLLLATGLIDALPEIPGLDELYGRSVFVCPYCDAWELRGQPLGVHGGGGAALALSLLTWSADVVLFTDGAGWPGPEDADKLTAAGIRVIDTHVTRLIGQGGVLERVELADGTSVRRRALFLKLAGQGQRSALAQQLELPVSDKQGVRTGDRECTSINGLYVAGDASRDLLFAVVAAAEGASAAFGINCELQAEEQEQMMLTRRQASQDPAVEHVAIAGHRPRVARVARSARWARAGGVRHAARGLSRG
ncbi:MAG: NAD(P)/FAD-dependent oxidoreductase [Nannocystis sp.]|nr:NAD(P)/FAD-dependent oxidoreductase [Nannocystis sp.]MBA3547321.1 NAD(P)/FAD-dependent oxidoreductase [Nannocystis sp.]